MIGRNINAYRYAKNNPWYPWLPIVLLSVLSIGLTFLFPRLSGFSFSEYTLGSISQEEIIAPFNFEILKSEEELKHDRENARNSIEPVFQRVDSISRLEEYQLSHFLAESKQFADTLAKTAFEGVIQDSVKLSNWQMLRNKYGINITYPSWNYLLAASSTDRMHRTSFIADKALLGILNDISAQGILNRSMDKIETPSARIRIIREGEESAIQLDEVYDITESRREALVRLEDIASKVWEEKADSVIKVGYEILLPFIEPNLIYDNDETDIRKHAIVDKVPIVKGIVLKDERIRCCIF
ncbi:hypothetical protein ACFLQJ_00915 [Calditrichota bacterium]